MISWFFKICSFKFNLHRYIEGVPPTYLIVAGLVFTTICVPYLKSEYGKDYDYDAPVKLLDRMMHDQVKAGRLLYKLNSVDP